MWTIQLTLQVQGKVHRETLEPSNVTIPLNIPDAIFDNLWAGADEKSFDMFYDYIEERTEEVLQALISQLVFEAEESWGRAIANALLPVIQKIIDLGPVHHPTRDDFDQVLYDELNTTKSKNKFLNEVYNEYQKVADKQLENGALIKWLEDELNEYKTEPQPGKSLKGILTTPDIDVVVSSNVPKDKLFIINTSTTTFDSFSASESVSGKPCLCNPRCGSCRKAGCSKQVNSGKPCKDYSSCFTLWKESLLNIKWKDLYG